MLATVPFGNPAGGAGGGREARGTGADGPALLIMLLPIWFGVASLDS